MAQSNFCPQCGAPLAPGQNFCPVCGAPVAAAPQQPVQPQQPQQPQQPVQPQQPQYQQPQQQFSETRHQAMKNSDSRERKNK